MWDDGGVRVKEINREEKERKERKERKKGKERSDSRLEGLKKEENLSVG